MNAPTRTLLPDRRTMLIALLGAGLLLALAFIGAGLTSDTALFSLQPPGGGAPDMLPAQRLDLHRTFFTIWAALVLVVPALSLFGFRHRSERAARYWLAFWTAALLVFLVHFYWAVVVLFGNDWQRILHTPRVSAPRLDTVFAVWWCVDVLLAWTLRSEAVWVRAQRWGVHLLAFVLFFMGAAREGELLWSRALGWSLAVCVALSLLWLAVRRFRRR